MTSSSEVSPQVRRRALAAGAIGNFVEWYDFIIYGSLASVLAKLFFPSGSATASLLATFAVFAVAFVLRPVGGFLFGHLGDRLGRRASLSLAVMVMSGATMLIGVLPTAGTIGVGAAVLLVILRCVQGVAVGGEWSGSAVYLVEYGDQRRRGLFASITPTGASLGAMAGVAVVTVLNATLGATTVADWAWRIPFLIAGPLGLVGLFLRLRLQDTPTFRELKSDESVERTPVREALRHHRKAIFAIFAGTAAGSAVTYAAVTFMVSYLTNDLHVPAGTALLTNTIAIGVTAVATVFAGRLADRIGRRPVLLGSMALTVVGIAPLFLLIGRGDFASVLIGQSVLGIFVGGMNAALAVLCVELFPARVRYSSGAIGQAIGAGFIGGSTPLVATALIAATGIVLAPAYYIIALVAVALVIIFLLVPETVDRDVSADVQREAQRTA